MKIQTLLFSLAALAVLAGCSDDSHSPASDPEYVVEIVLDNVETEVDLSEVDEVRALLWKLEPEDGSEGKSSSVSSDVSATKRVLRASSRAGRVLVASGLPAVSSRQESGDDDLYVVGSAARSGNAFRIALKTSIPSGFLTPVTEYFANYGDESCEVVFSDPDAKCSNDLLIHPYRQDEWVGEFWSETLTYPTVPEGEPEVSGDPTIRFIYVDRPVTIKGFDYSEDYDDWFDLSFQKGWNRYCWYNRTDGSYFAVSDIPAAHKWVYGSNPVWPI